MNHSLAHLVGAMFFAAIGIFGPAAAQSGANDKGDIPDDYASYVFVCPDGGYESGCDEQDVENAVLLEAADMAAFAERCLYRTKADCTVLASGRVNRATMEPSLNWQLLLLQPPDGPYAEMIVMAEDTGEDPMLLLAKQVDGYFDAPFAARDGDGKFLLHIPARNRGLGNADVMLFTSGQGWNWTTAALIGNEVDRLLPAGFSVASPISFNLREASAFALVRRDDDAGCCATGGVVNIDIEQLENSLPVTNIGFNETQAVGKTRYAAPAGTPDADSDVID